MDFIFGMFFVIIVSLISSIPIFIVYKVKKEYSNVIAWLLWIVCVVIYVIIRTICGELDIIDSSNPIPYFAMFLIYVISRIGVKEN